MVWLIVNFYILDSSVLDLVSSTSEIADCNQQITPHRILSYMPAKDTKNEKGLLQRQFLVGLSRATVAIRQFNTVEEDALYLCRYKMHIVM